MGFWAGLLVIFLGGSSARAGACDSFVRVGFELDLSKKLAQMHPALGKATNLCDPLPASENENVRMTVQVAGRKTFEHGLFVSLETYYDYVNHPGSTELHGGARAANQAFFLTILPERLLKQAEVKIEFHSLADGSLLAKWEGP